MKVNEKLSILLLLENSRISKKDGTVPITVRLTVDSKRAELSLGIRVDPKIWNQAGGFAVGNSQAAQQVNKSIIKAKAKLQQVYDDLEAEGGYVSAEMVKQVYRSGKEKSKTLIEVTDFVIERFTKKVQKEKRSAETLKKWITTKEKLKAFIKFNYDVNDLPLSKITYAFAEDMHDYLTLEIGIESNTAMKYIKNTKHVIKTAVERGWLLTNPIGGFKCSYIDPDRDILDELQLMNLYNKTFTVRRLEEIKDVYLFMCFTGYAYKDASLLTVGNISKFFDGEDWIVKNREKTWCRENVPLLPVAKEIIEKYKDHPCRANNGQLLPMISNQKYNSYLKEICEILGINKNLTTHTARHTFATTVTLANGVPLETVSALLGHKSIRTTQIYAKIEASKISQDMGTLKGKWIEKLPRSLKTRNAA